MKTYKDISILHEFGITTDLGHADLEKVMPKLIDRKMVNVKCIDSLNATYKIGGYYFMLQNHKCDE